MEPEFVAGRKVFEAHICDLTVGDANDGTAKGTDFCGSPDQSLRPRQGISNPEGVSYQDNPVKDDGDSTQYVFQRPLGGEGYGNAAYTDSRQGGSGVKTEVMEADQ